MSRRNLDPVASAQPPVPYVLRGIFASQCDPREQSARASKLLRGMRLPQPWMLQPIQYNQTASCSFEVVSEGTLDLFGRQLQDAAGMLSSLQVLHLKEADISILELRPLDDAAANDLSKFDPAARLFAIAINPEMVDDALKSRAATLSITRRSNYKGQQAAMTVPSVAASTASQPQLSAADRSSAMTAARTGRRAGVAPSSSSSAGPSRIQSTNVKTAGLPAQLQAIVNGTPSTGDDIKVYQNRIVRLDARVDQLTGENKQKGQELQDAHARIAELIKENASLKRKADDSDLYQNALKKARRSQRDILPDYKKGTPTADLDDAMIEEVLRTKQKLGYSMDKIEKLQEKIEELQATLEGRETDYDILVEDNERLMKLVPKNKQYAD